MLRSELKSNCGKFAFKAVIFAVLVSAIHGDVLAQNENENCPCFSFEEVEAMFLGAEQKTAAGGSMSCHARNYSVEFSAEVLIMDENFATVARAALNWSDFDPSSCDFVDVTASPAIDREERWPHPAPVVATKACFDIISSVIEKSDSAGLCTTYP